MKTSFALFTTVLILFAIGLLMVFNTTSAEVIGRETQFNPHAPMIKQLLFCLVGIGFSPVLYRIGYKNLIKNGLFFYLMALILLGLVFIPKIGMQLNGARRWIQVFGVSLQPSEFVKIVIPLFYLYLFFKNGEEKTFKKFCLNQMALMVPIFLIIIEPDNGTAFILLTTLVMLYFVTEVRWLYWVLPIIIVTTVATCFALNMKHVSDRIHVYLHPELDLLGKGHQPYQAKIAAGSGGLFGRGLGESLQKLNYLPEARSDYIAAIFAEEFGFCGILTLMLLYMTIATLGFRIAAEAPDKEGYYLATIITFVIAFQAFLNLGVVSGILPSKGTNLPFFSQGGSSLIGNIFMVTILINIHQTGRKICKKQLS